MPRFECKYVHFDMQQLMPEQHRSTACTPDAQIREGQWETPLTVQLLHPDARAPERAHDDDAGYDLFSVEDVALSPAPQAVATGIAVAIPPRCYGRVAPRSSLALRGAWVNGGVIDRGYTGEVRVIMACPAGTDLKIPAGTKIAQLILERIATPPVVVLRGKAVLPNTARGAGGFGSTDM